MKTPMLTSIAFGLLLFPETSGSLNPEGAKCGEKRCSPVEYCSPYDAHCRPCAEACDVRSHNYLPDECAKGCQDYLHDRRYVLREEWNRYEDLRGEVRTLRILTAVSLTITCLSSLVVSYLFAKAFLRWERVVDAFRRSFGRNWIKKTTNDGGGGGNNDNRVRDDAESGVVKQNGLKLTMPTISASVAPSRIARNASGNASDATSGSGSGSGSGSRIGSGTGNANGNGTPNTTSTPLSRRHPSEDTTLDYAYDNPAMTPSPETAQLGGKRESSF